MKTPLSVIVNEAVAHGNEPFAAKVLEQANIMRDQVTHHLERARIAARLTAVTTLTDITPVIDGLHRTMEKIHRDRDIEIEVKIAEPLKFRGERQDLEEMVGNLVDNACKWAQSQVHVEVLAERRAADDPMPMVQDHRRRRRARADGRRAGTGGTAWPASRRDQAGLGPRALDRHRSGAGSIAAT